jgi:D-alanyl-D-alanine dipeptidase
MPRLVLTILCLSLCAQERPKIFRISPVRPVAELRAEALAATPPHEEGNFRPADLVDVVTLDRRITLDIRYATSEIF